MRRFVWGLALLGLWGCTQQGDNITQIVGPEDWQGPELRWLTPPEAEGRGTVGLDVAVEDSSAVARVALYLDGQLHDTLTAPPYRFEVVTDSLEDGVHWAEARAWDTHGNLGISPVLRVDVMNSMAQGPRLLWVPDAYATIQAAINAATDYDTIRVRDGTYDETLNLFGKGIWVESEHGPLACTLDNSGANDVFYVEGNQVPATIRGFRLTGVSWLIYLWEGSQTTVCNNIFESDTASSFIVALNSGGAIVNNLFSGASFQVQPAYFIGTVVNNILQYASEFALYNPSTYGNPVTHGYNLFWRNGQDYGRFTPAVTDIHSDPMLDLELGRLNDSSPAIDAGEPSIYDKDGSRSDIGPFGGPHSYSP